MLNEIMQENLDLFESFVFQALSAHSEEIINSTTNQGGASHLIDEASQALGALTTLHELDDLQRNSPEIFNDPKTYWNHEGIPPYEELNSLKNDLHSIERIIQIKSYEELWSNLYIAHTSILSDLLEKNSDYQRLFDLKMKEVRTGEKLTDEEEGEFEFLRDHFEPFSWDNLISSSITCFFSTIATMLNYLPELKRIFERYKTINDLGECDYSKCIAKLQKLLLDKIHSSPFVPLSDCSNYIAVCMISYSGHENVNAEAQTSNEIGEAYEQECYQKLLQSGYSIKETPKTGDFGCDLMAVKSEISFCIQCKMHGKPVGVAAIQQAVSAKDYYDCDFAVVTSESAFTDAALKMANKLNVMCLSSKQLGEIDNLCGQYT